MQAFMQKGAMKGKGKMGGGALSRGDLWVLGCNLGALQAYVPIPKAREYR